MNIASVTMRRAFCVAIICILHVTSAFVTPSTTAFTSGPNRTTQMRSMNKHAPPLMMFGKIKNLWGRVKDKFKQVDEDLQKKQQELVQKASRSIRDFDVYLTKAIENKSAEMTQEVAVEFVKLLKGSWDAMISVNDTDTKAAMDDTLNAVSDKVVSLVGSKDEDKDEQTEQVKAELASYRLRIENIIEATVYPLRLQLQVYLGPTLAIQAFGQLTFDVLEHTLDFVLDKLIVFDVEVLLTSVLEAVNAAEDADDDDEEEEKITVAETKEEDEEGTGETAD